MVNEYEYHTSHRLTSHTHKFIYIFPLQFQYMYELQYMSCKNTETHMEKVCAPQHTALRVSIAEEGENRGLKTE